MHAGSRPAPRCVRRGPRGVAARACRGSAPEVTYAYAQYSEVIYGRVPSVLHGLLEGVASWALGAVVTVATASRDDRPHLRYAAAPLSPPEEVISVLT